MHLAVAVGQMDVPDQALQLRDVVERRVREMEVRDVGVRAHGRVVDLAHEADELVDVLDQRLRERLELEHDLDSLRRAYSPASLTHRLGHVPDRLAREHLAVPVVLADDEQDVASAEVGALVDIGLDAVEREALHRGVEVDDAEGDADDGTDRQPDLLAGLLDLCALVVGQVERVLEDVVGVEADLLRLRMPSSRPTFVSSQVELIIPSSMGKPSSPRYRHAAAVRRPPGSGFQNSGARSRGSHLSAVRPIPPASAAPASRSGGCAASSRSPRLRSPARGPRLHGTRLPPPLLEVCVRVDEPGLHRRRVDRLQESVGELDPGAPVPSLAVTCAGMSRQ